LPPRLPEGETVAAARRSHWLRVLVFNAGGVLLASVIALGAGGPERPQVWRVVAMSLVYTTCIGAMFALVLPAAMRRFGGRGAVGLAVRLAGLAVGIAAGLPLGAVVLVTVGLVDRAEFLAHAMPTQWPFFVFPTMLLVSLGMAYYMTMTQELAQATIALRTKERDEAIARQQAAEAQLAAVEARVQPHFLFNTLNSIAALIPEDAAGAERMVERVAALMRSLLQNDGPSTSPLGEELRLVRDYLEIERVRFRERLRYDLRVAPGLEHVAVPRLSVQTLVENAVKYAVARQRAGATIVIAVAASEGRASISVSDDGPGFDLETQGDGHGLRLLRSRLDTLFGVDAALRIDSRPGATTCVIEVPVR
jgi:signal transduction histidine kinase